MSIPTDLILAAELLERMALSRAATYRAKADATFDYAERVHFLHLASVQDSLAEAQRKIIKSLRSLALLRRNLDDSRDL